MEIISTKVKKETREKMRKLSYINWSEVIREMLNARIKEEEEKSRTINRNLISEAARLAADVRKKTEGWDSTKEIRKWRDQTR